MLSVLLVLEIYTRQKENAACVRNSIGLDPQAKYDHYI